jgi:glutamine synthetase type III
MRVRKELIGRLELGLKNYKHGVRVDDETISWVEMAREELLDAVIYIIADYIRNIRKNHETVPENDEPDDNKLIMKIADEWEYVESPQHKMLLWNLFKMLNSDVFA